MNDYEAVETGDEVLATARAAGFSPTAKQRKDWRAAGLLSSPLRQAGRGRGRGSITLYPPGTGVLLAAICRHSRPKKPLRDVAFLVWWDGYPVAPELIRERLTRELRRWEEWRDLWRLADEEVYDRWRLADEEERRYQITQFAAGPLPEPLRAIRRRVGQRGFETVLSVFARLASGQFSDWAHQDEMAAFRDGLSLDRAMRDRIGNARPWLSPSLRHPLRELAASLAPSALQTVLMEAELRHLAQARDELQALFGFLYTARLTAESMLGIGALGLGLLPLPSELNHKVAPGLLLLWLAVRRIPTFYAGYQTLMQFAESGAPVSFFIELMRSTGTRELPRRLEPSEA